MNIEDVDEIPKEALTLDNVFQHQLALMEKYHKIEGREQYPNLDTREGQQVVKDFLWRITEEVGEALDSDLGINHIKEELADGLHFLIELAILTGRQDEVKKEIHYRQWTPNQEIKGADFHTRLRYESIHNFLIQVAMVGRVCKNKPWKQTQIPLDQIAFTTALVDLAEEYFLLCECYYDTQEEIYSFYLRKAQVNQFRQRSGY